jgi:D-glycero-D-manno-heptose 1,7-bisphosphate phosphatase
MEKLIIFDADGTLVATKSGSTFRQTSDDWQWLPGRLEKLAELKAKGVRLAVATNQGGVAFGYMKQEAILRELSRMIKEAGIPAGGLYICYTHPKATIEQYSDENDTRRKPGPGMLFDAMRDFDSEPEETLFVGDRPEDEEAAAAAGCDFIWAKDFFDTSQCHICGGKVEDATPPGQPRTCDLCIARGRKKYN